MGTMEIQNIEDEKNTSVWFLTLNSVGKLFWIKKNSTCLFEEKIFIETEKCRPLIMFQTTIWKQKLCRG